jgi:hypothetical protein
MIDSLNKPYFWITQILTKAHILFDAFLLAWLESLVKDLYILKDFDVHVFLQLLFSKLVFELSLQESFW